MSRAPHVINLKCVNCGAGLEISDDMDRFACGYCGVEQIVERKGGTVALRHVTDAISKVQRGTDKTAAELAIKRLKEERAAIDVRYKRRQEHGAREMHQVNKETAWIIFIAIIVGAVLQNLSSWLMPIIVILAIAGAGYRKRENDRPIKRALRANLDAIRREAEEIESRLARNREIANS